MPSPAIDAESPPLALTIAGSDPGGGAGIQADLKTFAAHGVFGCAAITALTAQCTTGVSGVHVPPPAFVRQQVRDVLRDMGCDAAKTGMLASADVVMAVADAIAEFHVRCLVVDPVMVAKGGARLLAEDAVTAYRERVLPLAALVTPNAAETEVLCGFPVRDEASMRAAARALVAMGAKAALVKGGHVDAEPGVALDVLLAPAAASTHGLDAEGFLVLRAPRLASRMTHGTGCTLSAAITARLARGEALPLAVAGAKAWLTRALERGFVPGRGKGHGSPDHGTPER